MLLFEGKVPQFLYNSIISITMTKQTILYLRQAKALISLHMSLVVRKPVFGVSDQVQHNPGCTVTEDGERLEILDLERRRIVLSV